jgi:hypothetical protein
MRGRHLAIAGGPEPCFGIRYGIAPSLEIVDIGERSTTKGSLNSKQQKRWTRVLVYTWSQVTSKRTRQICTAGGMHVQYGPGGQT